MASDPNPNETPKDEKPKKAKVSTVTLQHLLHSDWTLSIGGDDYPVVDGRVGVPVWHVTAAEQAGFQRA